MIAPKDKHKRIRYWCGDESRVGLKTANLETNHAWWHQAYRYHAMEEGKFLFIRFSRTVNWRILYLEFSALNIACFNTFLEQFATTYSEDIHIIQLDNGAFHLSKTVQIPEHIIFLFQPPHTPQVNPIERLWEEVKRYLSWECFGSLDELRTVIWQRLEELNTSIVASITG